jgi:hypothetical protein
VRDAGASAAARDLVVTNRRPKADRLRELLEELAQIDAEAGRLRARRRKIEAKLRRLGPSDPSALDRSILFFLSTNAGRPVSLRAVHEAIASARPTAWRTVQQRLLALHAAGHVRSIQAIGRGGTWPHWLLADAIEAEE